MSSQTPDWKQSPKSVLYEYCSQNKIPIPNFIVKQFGEDHEKVFLTEAIWEVSGMKLSGIGSGSTKKYSEKEAIYNLCLQFFENEKPWVKNYVFNNKKIEQIIFPKGEMVEKPEWEKYVRVGSSLTNAIPCEVVLSTAALSDWFVDSLPQNLHRACTHIFNPTPAQFYTEQINKILKMFYAIIGGFYEDCGNDSDRTIKYFFPNHKLFV